MPEPMREPMSFLQLLVFMCLSYKMRCPAVLHDNKWGKMQPSTHTSIKSTEYICTDAATHESEHSS